MDLRRALYIMGHAAHLDGTSAASDAAYAQTDLTHSTAMPIAYLDGGIHGRLAELLLHLAYATRLDYAPTVFDVYRQWALARYIGVFDLMGTTTPTAILSNAGQGVVLNQRRVLSEDLGIGMAAMLAREWVRARFPQYDVHLVDIDVAVQAGLIQAPANRRADYLLLAYDANATTALALGVLECKGSESRKHALRQLGSGAEQVEQTLINHHQLPGLVSSLHSGRNLMQYHVAEVLPPGMAAGAVDLPVAEETMTLFGASWARLADIANDTVVYDRFAPSAVKVRRTVESSASNVRQEREVQGRAYIGTETRIPLPGGELRYFLGADAEIIDALRRADVSEALTTKSRVGSDPRRPTSTQNDSTVSAATADGVALELRQM